MSRIDRVRRGAAIGVFASLLGAWFAVGLAAAQGGFAIRDVPVEATGESPLAARDAALHAGYRAAWRKLLEAEAPDQAARLGDLPQAELERLVEGFEVAGEHLTTSRYTATMTVYFRPDPVRALLARSGAGPQQIDARAAFTSLNEWAEIRRRLSESPAVSRVQIRGLSSAEARLALTLTTGPERAASSLAAQGILLAQGPDGWRLSLGAP